MKLLLDEVRVKNEQTLASMLKEERKVNRRLISKVSNCKGWMALRIAATGTSGSFSSLVCGCRYSRLCGDTRFTRIKGLWCGAACRSTILRGVSRSYTNTTANRNCEARRQDDPVSRPRETIIVLAQKAYALAQPVAFASSL